MKDHRWRGRFSHRTTYAMRLRLRIQMHDKSRWSQMRHKVTRSFPAALMCHVEHEGLRCGSPFLVEPWMAANSVFWTAISPIPSRAEKPNDHPGAEPGEHDAQSYRDQRLHNRYSENISLSLMYSICRAYQGVGERSLTVSRELARPCL